MSIGIRLKEYARSKGGVSKLAEMLNISQPRLSQYISEKNQIDQEVLVSLAHLGCDLTYIFTGVWGMDLSKIEEKFAEYDKKMKELTAEIDSIKNMNEALQRDNNELLMKNLKLESENKILRVNLAKNTENNGGQGMESSSQY